MRPGVARGLDHLVVAVHSLERARKVYGEMGFTLTPVAQHPFGTANSLVQLDRFFLEFLTVADFGAIPVPEPGAFSFPRFNHRFLERFEGISMLVLESGDAEADGREFTRNWLQAYLPFEFGRDARMPDGTTERVGFKLAFASDPLIPDAGFFTCQQLNPGAFWKPDYQRHANTAETVLEVVMVAEAPSDHHAFFEGFAGTRDLHASSMGLTVETPRGRIMVLTPRAATALWGEAIDVQAFRTSRFAATTIGVRDLAAAEACLSKSGIAAARRDGRLIVPAGEAMGMAVAFEELPAEG